MLKVLSLICVSMSFIVWSCVSPRPASAVRVLTLDPSRAVNITGVIGPDIRHTSAVLARLVADSSDPIYVVIDSPGGFVDFGLEFIQVMTSLSPLAPIRCVVTDRAHSMAFYIFAHCPERYATPTATLMWHRLSTRLCGYYQSSTLQGYVDYLMRSDEDAAQVLLKQTGMDPQVFYHNRDNEVYWSATEAESIAPGFLQLLEIHTEGGDDAIQDVHNGAPRPDSGGQEIPGTSGARWDYGCPAPSPDTVPGNP